MITYSPRAPWSLFVLVSLALTVGMSRTSSAQTPSCGNAYDETDPPPPSNTSVIAPGIPTA